MDQEQYVCLVCGYNMVGFFPDKCPFCGANQEMFITAEECAERFRVVSTPVNENVTRLNSEPSLGYEHAAYRIEVGDSACWIDCPSSFNPSIDPVETILFTHHHFLGASNLYRERFSAKLHIHQSDSAHELSRPFTFDNIFTDDFHHHGIDIYHINGHTSGFTVYIFEETLFICDYVFWKNDSMQLNPFGPSDRTLLGAESLFHILDKRSLATVCGYNYVINFDDWWSAFINGPLSPPPEGCSDLLKNRNA